MAEITHNTFPKQGAQVGKEFTVIFNMMEGHPVKGVCVRDDMEAPFVTLFRLEDGRYVGAGECQYKS